LEFLVVAMNEQNHCIYEFGPFRLDARKRLLLREGKTVKLFPKEFDTLLALVEQSGEVLDKDELMRRVWGDVVVEESNLTTNISHLRKVLGEKPNQHQYIVTVPGQGYRFVAGVRAAGFDEVIVRERKRAEITVEEEEISSADSSDERTPLLGRRDAQPSFNPQSPASPAGAGIGKNLLFVAAVSLVVATLAFGSYYLIRQRQSKDKAAAPFPEIRLTRLTNSGRVTKTVISPDGKYFVHVLESAEGQSLWVRQVEVITASQQIIPPRRVEYWGLTFSPDGNYVYCVVWESTYSKDVSLYQVPVLGGAATKLPFQPNSPISFSPDGKQIAFYDTRPPGTRLMVANLDDATTREIARRQPPDYFCAIHIGPAWSPDGRVIAAVVNTHDEIGQREAVVGVNPVDGSERIITPQRWWAVKSVAWMRDGSGMLATIHEQISSPAQVWHISYPGGVARKVTNDLNQYSGLSLTADSRAIVTVQTSTVSGLWVAPTAESPSWSTDPIGFLGHSKFKQIASEVGNIPDFAWMPDGRLVYVSLASGTGNLWEMRPDGSNPKQLTTDAQAKEGISVSLDGRYIVFASGRSGDYNIWRADADGSNLKQLTDGKGDLFPHFSPDNRWVVFQRGAGLVTPTLWKVPVDGGQAVQLTDTRVQKPRVSPDGKLVAYYYLGPDTSGESRWSIGVVPLEGGRRLKSFAFPPMVSERLVRWTPDGKAVAYLDSRRGVSDIWVQPLDGSHPWQLTEFKTEQTAWFDWSRDGRHLAVVRRIETSDAVLIEEVDRVQAGAR
jgi:Tol biopolymer transport system component/DNA-binding winged helix-turn-helix (wHTH) protein